MQLAGELAKMNLASLIRLVRNGELTGKICLTQGVNSAFIFFENGHPVHIESDRGVGKRALLELFAWQTGTFTYVECDVSEQPRTISTEEPLEKVLKEGLSFQESLRYLEQLRINARTVFRLIQREEMDSFLLHFDGKNSLADVVKSANMSRSEYVPRLHQALAGGRLIVLETPKDGGEIKLPDWVILRLKQENLDVSQAIVDLVVWADRVKCWLYQADVDLHRIIQKIDEDESSYQNLAQSGSYDYVADPNAETGSYGAVTDPAAATSYGYVADPDAETGNYGAVADPAAATSYGYVSDPNAETGNYGAVADPAGATGSYGYVSDPNAETGNYGAVADPAAAASDYVADPNAETGNYGAIADPATSANPRVSSPQLSSGAAKIPLRGGESPAEQNSVSVPGRIPLRGAEATSQASPPQKPARQQAPSRPQPPVPPNKPTPPSRPERTSPPAPGKLAQPPSYDF